MADSSVLLTLTSHAQEQSELFVWWARDRSTALIGKVGVVLYDYPHHHVSCSCTGIKSLLHYLGALLLDIIGCLPFDPAPERLLAFVLLLIAVIPAEVEPSGWSSTLNKGGLVTTAAAYGGTVVKAWKERQEERAAGG